MEANEQQGLSKLARAVQGELDAKKSKATGSKEEKGEPHNED